MKSLVKLIRSSAFVVKLGFQFISTQFPLFCIRCLSGDIIQTSPLLFFIAVKSKLELVYMFHDQSH